MVLEEATSPEEPSPSFSESAPSSDVDTYAGDRSPTVLQSSGTSYVPVNAQPGANQIYVNLNNLPQRWASSNQAPLARPIQETCKQASQVLGRPVNQEEADALAFHLARANRIASYGQPIGVAVATVFWYRGLMKGNLRFPGWTPNPEKYSLDRFSTLLFRLKGTQARIMWHTSRGLAYTIVGSTLGGLFFGAYALTAGSASRMMDPRLKELMEKIRADARRGGALPGQREVDQTPGQRQKEGETWDMARQRRQAQEMWRRNRQPTAAQGGDDMSPTGGAFAEDFVESGSTSKSDTTVLSDDQARSQIGALQSYQNSLYEEVRKESKPRQEPARNVQRDAFSSAEPAAESKPTGSAWERLRQQAASGGQNTSSSRTYGPQARSRPSSSDSDSFSFSQGDEDKQLARAEAQKQFDARIEREREGKDFEDSSRRRGW